MAKDRNEITEIRRRQKIVTRARTDEALRTVAALKCLAFVHWEGVNPDGTPSRTLRSSVYYLMPKAGAHLRTPVTRAPPRQVLVLD